MPERVVGRPICLPGMGRCGTSLTTRLVGLLGVDLGPDSGMMPAVEQDNARGYWEQTAIYEINEGLLQAFGGSWADPPELSEGWEHTPAVEDMRERTMRTLAALFPDHAARRWAFKDPRAALTLPFWKSVVGEMDYIVCVRNPAEVAMSLGARRGTDHVSFEVSLALWARYVSAALANTEDGRRLIVHYDNYFNDTAAQLERLADFVLGPEPSGHAIDRLKRVVEAELWHHRRPAAKMAEVHEVCPQALELYLQLRERDPLTSSRAQSRPG